MTLVNDKLKNHLQCVQSSQPYQKLINHALELEQRGGQINMCNALEELRQEGIEEGRLEGRQEGRREGRWEGILEGIRATVRTCRNFNISETDTVRNIMNEFSL